MAVGETSVTVDVVPSREEGRCNFLFATLARLGGKGEGGGFTGVSTSTEQEEHIEVIRTTNKQTPLCYINLSGNE